MIRIVWIKEKNGAVEGQGKDELKGFTKDESSSEG